MTIIQRDAQAWPNPSPGVPTQTLIDAEVPAKASAVDFLKHFFGEPLKTVILGRPTTATRTKLNAATVILRRSSR